MSDHAGDCGEINFVHSAQALTTCIQHPGIVTWQILGTNALELGTRISRSLLALQSLNVLECRHHFRRRDLFRDFMSHVPATSILSFSARQRLADVPVQAVYVSSMADQSKSVIKISLGLQDLSAYTRIE